MIQTTNFPLSTYSLQKYGSWKEVRKQVKELGLNGLEVIADPDNLADDIPRSLVKGYHMTFYVDWVDFWRQDEAALMHKFGSWDVVREVYRGTKPEDLLRHFQEDLALGIRLGAPYMVFHVSDVSLEEGYTYRWLHTDQEVLDASIEFINALLEGVEPTFDFLVENQWWPGFTFTDPVKTEYLLSRIKYPRVGIMLDTGHLMNTNWKLHSQWEGIQYILDMVRKHGELSKRIYGMHFHQSISGAYCRKTVGKLPDDFPLDYYEEFSRNYSHILQIDRHRPWTEEECCRILERVQPKYLTHEIAGNVYRGRISAIRSQIFTIQRGYFAKLNELTDEQSVERRKNRNQPRPSTGNPFLDRLISGTW